MPLTPLATMDVRPLVPMTPGRIRRTIAFLRRFCDVWKQDRVSSMAAALAYYTFLALAPILLLAVLIAGALLGEAAARGEIVERTRETIGLRGAEAVQGILQSAGRPGEGVAILGVGLLALLIGASRAFQELQKGLSRILTGPLEKIDGRKGLLRHLLSLGLVLSVGPGLVLVMLGGMAFEGARRSLGLPSGLFVGRFLDYLLTFALGAGLLSLLYRFVPDKRAEWREVGIGAGVSACLFVLSRLLVSLYVGRTTITSSYGAAGLFVVILIWVHLSAQIVYFGAEVIRLRAGAKAASPGQPR